MDYSFEGLKQLIIDVYKNLLNENCFKLTTSDIGISDETILDGFLFEYDGEFYDDIWEVIHEFKDKENRTSFSFFKRFY